MLMDPIPTLRQGIAHQSNVPVYLIRLEACEMQVGHNRWQLLIRMAMGV
jgi:hypothetical protein